MLITAWVGMVLAPKPITWHWTSFITGLAGIGLIAASGGAMNHLAEISVDQKMQRTAQRPLAIGQLSKAEVWQFCVICILLGTGLLWQFNNLFSAILSITMLGYGFFTQNGSNQGHLKILSLAGSLAPYHHFWAGFALPATCQLNHSYCAYYFHMDTTSFLGFSQSHQWLPANRLPNASVTHGILYTSLSIILYTILMIISSQLPILLAWMGSSISLA